jgi:PKD repeat protein
MPHISRYVLPIYDLTIIAWPLMGYAPHTVNFDSIIRGGTPPYTYSWDFGDGSPLSTEAKPTHTYSVSGVYTVKLTVTDSLGLSAETTIKVTVVVPLGWVTLSMVQLTYNIPTDVQPALPYPLNIAYNTPTDMRPALNYSLDITYTVPTDVQSAISLNLQITYTVSGSVS